MTSLRMWVPFFFLAVGCGTDETMDPPASPTPSQSSNVPSVDLCRAMWALVSAPGVSERVCALQTNTASTRQTIEACKLCATSLALVTNLSPNPSCATPREDCPVEAAELSACFTTIGSTLAELAPTCDRMQAAGAAGDPALLALTLATSNCGPVLTRCQPLQELVQGLIGAGIRAR